MAFPNFKNKHGKEAVFSPKDFLKYNKSRGKHPKFKFPNNLIFCFSRRLLKHIVSNHGAYQAEEFKPSLYLFRGKNKNLGVVGNFGIGAPGTATVMEEMIAAGAKNFILIGEAGTIQKNIKIGSIVVCERAIRDEGTSHHYLKPSKYSHASADLVNKIKKSLNNIGKEYVVGTSWTIDAPYRETVAEARKYQKEGVATVEMEASAVFAVAKYRKVKAAAIFTVSDSLAELKWEPKFHLSNKNWEILFQAAKNALLK